MKRLPMLSIAFPIVLGAAFLSSFFFSLLVDTQPAIDQWLSRLTAIVGILLVVMQIRQSLELSKVKQVAVATHTLSNSAMGAQLQSALDDAVAGAVQAHKLAELTNDPGYQAAALASDVKVVTRRALLQAHQVQQAKVDAQLNISATS